MEFVCQVLKSNVCEILQRAYITWHSTKMWGPDWTATNCRVCTTRLAKHWEVYATHMKLIETHKWIPYETDSSLQFATRWRWRPLRRATWSCRKETPPRRRSCSQETWSSVQVFILYTGDVHSWQLGWMTTSELLLSYQVAGAEDRDCGQARIVE